MPSPTSVTIAPLGIDSMNTGCPTWKSPVDAKTSVRVLELPWLCASPKTVVTDSLKVPAVTVFGTVTVSCSFAPVLSGPL